MIIINEDELITERPELKEDQDYVLLSKEEVEALYNELSHSWISRENDLCYQLMNKFGDWLSSFEVQKDVK